MKKLIIAAVIAVTPVAVSAATLNEFRFDSGDYAINFDGDFTPGTARAFTSKIEAMRSAGKRVTAVFLNSPGGLINEGVMVANAIGNYNIRTFVLPNEYCASACFLVFAAGNIKAADVNAHIGVHSASNGQGVANEYSKDATRTMARAAAKWGVSPDIVDRIENTPPNDMAWLSSDDLKMMGVSVDDYTKNNKTQTASLGKTTTGQKNAEWEKYISWSFKTSERQFGRVLSNNICTKIHCQTSVVYNDKNNSVVAVVVDMQTDNKTVKSRYICRTSLENKDYRSCTDWDSGEVFSQTFDGKAWAFNN
jgi:hypothetical protein